MDAADLARLSQLLDQVLDLESAERAAWLLQLAPADQPLAGDLQAMLAAHDQPHSGLDQLPELGDESPESAAPKAGDSVGPYRLLSELGRGGMGVVWLAERADGSFERRVALKLPHLGWGEALASNMARERSIAARLEHPDIARLYDAGIDAQGRPYLALQFVDGLAIDYHCAAKGLNLRQRLSLFVNVLRAVAYAHAHLDVHRDIKPSNVMVTDAGQVQLLDFGVARLLTPEFEGTDATQGPPLGLTPAYAAPEQMRGERISIACDIYSLGLLLHQLLIDRLPWAKPSDSQGSWQAGLLRAQTAHALPAASSLAAPALAKQLRGELDAVLARALAFEPSERYPTVDAFADDVLRYLSNRPVQARLPSPWLRWRKALQRHRVAVLAGASVLLSLTAAATVATLTARRAEVAALRATTVKNFVVDIFRSNGRADSRQLPAHALLERGAHLIDDRFAAQPDLRAELFGVVGGVLVDLGHPNAGLGYVEKQVKALQEMGVSGPELAAAMLLQARAQLEGGQYKQAYSQAEAAAGLLGAADPLLALQISLLQLDALLRQGHLPPTGPALARVKERLKVLPEVPAGLRAELLHLEANRLSYFLNQFDQALPLYVQAIALAVQAEGEGSMRAFAIRSELAKALFVNRRGPEAEPFLHAALQAQRRLGGPGDLFAALAEASNAKWAYMSKQWSYAKASATIAASIAAVKLQAGEQLPADVLAKLQYNQAALLLSGGEVVQAHALLAAAVPTLERVVENAWFRYLLEYNQGLALLETGRQPQADKLLAAALARGTLAVGERSPFLVDAYVAGLTSLRMQGRFKEAQVMQAGWPQLDALPAQPSAPWQARDALDLARAELALAQGQPKAALLLLPKDESAAVADADEPLHERRLLRGAALCALGEPGAGLVLMEDRIKSASADLHPDHPGLAYWRVQAGLCALRAGKPERARALATLAQASLHAQPDVAPYYKSALLPLLAQLPAKAITPRK